MTARVRRAWTWNIKSWPSRRRSFTTWARSYPVTNTTQTQYSSSWPTAPNHSAIYWTGDDATHVPKWWFHCPMELAIMQSTWARRPADVESPHLQSYLFKFCLQVAACSGYITSKPRQKPFAYVVCRCSQGILLTWKVFLHTRTKSVYKRQSYL